MSKRCKKLKCKGGKRVKVIKDEETERWRRPQTQRR